MRSVTKSLTALVLTFCLLLTAGFTALAAGEGTITLFDADTPLFILLPETPDESVTAAAETLADYLEQITGKRPQTLTNLRGAPDGAAISLGYAEALQGQPKGSYTLRADAGSPIFYIEAADARGLFNGVYGFLRRVCGVEIYAADVKRVPRAEKIEAETPYTFSYTPTLEYADTDWLSPHDLEFALANGLNGTYSPIESVYGGKVNYIWFCHSLTNGIVPEGELFESHPEYFALTKNGKREATQLCLSNPEVVERAISDVKNQLAQSYDPDAALNIVSVTQDDNQDYCLCENCTAIANRYGGQQSGLMLWFVNQIAEAIEPEYPDVVVDTFAYQYTRQAPTGITPRDNVCVRLCSIECCFSHALDDPACERNIKFMKDLEDWSKISNRLYVWDYTTNYSQTLGVFPDFGVMRRNIDVFRSHSVVGIYEEGAYYAGQCNVGFVDLSAYLLSCFMRDEMTAEEERELTKGFMDTYYGGTEAGAAMLEILDIITAHAGDEDGHLGIGQSMKSSLYSLSNKDAEHIDDLWQTALEAANANGDTAAAERIERSRLAWRYYEACACKGAFKSPLPFIGNVKENRALINDLLAAGVTRYNEGRTLGDMKLSPYDTPDRWGNTDTGAIIAALIGTAVIALLTLLTAIVALRKKHPVCALLLVLLLIAAAITGAFASKLFIEWDNLPLYGFVDALMLLSVFGFFMIAAWAKNGCELPKGKKLVGTVLIGLTVAALPYELIVLLINTIIYHSHEPTCSIALSSFCQMAVIAVCLAVTVIGLRKTKKEEK